MAPAQRSRRWPVRGAVAGLAAGLAVAGALAALPGPRPAPPPPVTGAIPADGVLAAEAGDRRALLVASPAALRDAGPWGPAEVTAWPPLTAPGVTVAPGPATAPEGRLSVAGTVFRAPVDDAVLVGRFRAPRTRWGAGHRGVDLAVADGTRVVAPADGVVVFSGVVVDRPVVTLLHADGLRSSLEPVASSLTPGAVVLAGEPVGRKAGATHCGPACLHWGVRDGDAYVDPLDRLAGDEPVVLLPAPAG